MISPASPTLAIATPPLSSSSCSLRWTLCCNLSIGLICLASSITALCCALLWHTPWLSIPFGIGIIGSAYLTYTAYSSRHLKGLEEEVSGLQATHKQFLQAHTKQLEETGKQNQTLRQEVTHLAAENHLLEEQIKTLTTQTTALHQENERLSQIGNRIEGEVSELIASLQQLSLSHQDHLDTLSGGLQALNTTLQQASEQVAARAQQQQALHALSQQLERLFTSLADRVKQYDTSALCQNIQDLTSQYQGLTQLRQRQLEANASLEQTTLLLRQEVIDLTRIKEELKQCVEALKREVLPNTEGQSL